MGKNKRIIDLYGLPGAGKTTICNSLLEKKDYQVAKISGLMELYKTQTFLFKVFHLPLYRWTRLTLFIISVPNISKVAKSEIISFYYIVLAYSFFQHQSCYNYLIVDHGLIQQLASVLHDNRFIISNKALKLFVAFLKKMEPLDKVYCLTSKEFALERMKLRNRNAGRLDAIMNDTSVVLELLDNEKKLFDKVSELVDNRVTINMEDTASSMQQLSFII